MAWNRLGGRDGIAPVRRPPELDPMASRLAADYRPRVEALGSALDVWANSTQVGVEILGTGQRHLAKKVRYAYRVIMLGRTMPLRSLEEVDRTLRATLDAWIAQASPSAGS